MFGRLLACALVVACPIVCIEAACAHAVEHALAGWNHRHCDGSTPHEHHHRDGSPRPHDEPGGNNSSGPHHEHSCICSTGGVAVRPVAVPTLASAALVTTTDTLSAASPRMAGSALVGFYRADMAVRPPPVPLLI
ncbi:MAG: hypothetical protein IPM13_11860 [Phycisphaerales bacterium]|nr:hypothetical protein [Phycisphaerales bacterium]